MSHELNCSALFTYIGVSPEIKIAKSLGLKSDRFGYIKTDFNQRTTKNGVFVAGDVCGDLKHIIAACGQGAKAAYNANKYLIGARNV